VQWRRTDYRGQIFPGVQPVLGVGQCELLQVFVVRLVAIVDCGRRRVRGGRFGLGHCGEGGESVGAGKKRGRKHSLLLEIHSSNSIHNRVIGNHCCKSKPLAPLQ